MTAAVTSSILCDLVSCPHRVRMDVHGNRADRDLINPFIEVLWEEGGSLYETEVKVIDGLGTLLLDLSIYSGEQKERRTTEAMHQFAIGRSRLDRRGRMAVLNASSVPCVASVWIKCSSAVRRTCGEWSPPMRRITIKRALTWHYRKTRLCIERSSALATLPAFPSWPDCTINTSGYDFRKGQVTGGGLG